MNNARIYLRVSTQEQDLTRQERLIEEARSAGYYIAGVYKEKASGACPDRPELLRMIAEEKRMYKGRKADKQKHAQIMSLRSMGGVSPRQTAAITGYTYQHVLRVWRQGKEKVKEKINKEAERGQQDIEMFLQHEK